MPSIPAAPAGDPLYATYRSSFKGEPHPIEPGLMTERYGRLLRRTLEPGIDLGAGSGEFIEWLSREGVKGVWGVDISPEQVQAATERRRDVRIGELFTVLGSTADQSLASLFARDVLEHLDKPQLRTFAAEAARVLRPGGILFVQVPNAAGLRFGPVWAGDLTHTTMLSGASLGQLMRSAGLVTDAMWGITPGRQTLARRLRSIAWALIATAVSLVDLVESGTREAVYERVLCASFIKP